jgi:hypothetical protein
VFQSHSAEETKGTVLLESAEQLMNFTKGEVGSGEALK